MVKNFAIWVIAHGYNVFEKPYGNKFKDMSTTLLGFTKPN